MHKMGKIRIGMHKLELHDFKTSRFPKCNYVFFFVFVEQCTKKEFFFLIFVEQCTKKDKQNTSRYGPMPVSCSF